METPTPEKTPTEQDVQRESEFTMKNLQRKMEEEKKSKDESEQGEKFPCKICLWKLCPGPREYCSDCSRDRIIDYNYGVDNKYNTNYDTKIYDFKFPY